ncbi:MAG: phosphonate C-P lyase system protein PhnH [Rhabdaerophilum sp.]
MRHALSPGFSAPVFEQQQAFRVTMDALSRPGRVVPYRAALEDVGLLSANAAAIALTLLDFEVSFHLAPSLAEAESYITFHTGARLAGHARDAEFAFIDLRRDRLELSAFAQGVPDYPDRSTTIIALCDALSGGEERALRGPGIATFVSLGVTNLPEDFTDQWHANSARMPLGVDLIFVSLEGLLGLPRSTRIIGEVR